MEKLPSWIYFNGNIYHLFENVLEEEPIKGWYSFLYAENKDSLPVGVSDGEGKYFLCACDPDKETAYNDMLGRLNNMKPWVI